MDITTVKTFIAVIEGGTFVAAAKRVHVTQSTVSARIKALEMQLGKAVFIRTKSICELTSAGEQFYRYARSMVRAWEDGKHQVAVPDAFTETLIIGGQYSVWNRMLNWWLDEFRANQPEIAVRAEVGTPSRLIREMVEGVMDLAIMYRPELRPGLNVEELFKDELILVTARPDEPLEENYIYIDWGEQFRNWHAVELEELHNPGLTLDLGALGVNYLANFGKSGYFPRRIILPHLQSGALFMVPNMPSFPYPAYIVYQDDFAEPLTMEKALNSLRVTAAKAINGELPDPFWA